VITHELQPYLRNATSFEPHVILDGRHALDAACNLNCFVFIGAETHKTARLDHTLESFNVDFGGFQSRFVEYGRLDLGGDDAVVNLFAATLLR
jgi:hypothetical protein